jgi:hypothetical protein
VKGYDPIFRQGAHRCEVKGREEMCLKWDYEKGRLMHGKEVVFQAVLWLRRLVAGFPPRRPKFEPRSGHVGFVVDKVSLGRVSSEYFGFLCQFSFHRLLHTHHLSSEAGTNTPNSGRRTKWTQSHPIPRDAP